MFTIKNILLANHGQKGFTLIELIISLSVALLLMNLLLAIYLAGLKSENLQYALNQIQNNAKIATHILQKEIHRAGYIGCAHLNNDFPLVGYENVSLTPQNKISVKQDALTLRHLDMHTVQLVEPMKSSSILVITKSVHFLPGDILMLTDCKQGEIFKIKASKLLKDVQILYTNNPLKSLYTPPAEVGRFAVNTFFVAKTKRNYGDSTPIYSLYVKNQNYQSELVEGIKSMSIHFLTTQGSTKEIPTYEVDDVAKVKGISIEFVVSSPPIQKKWYLYSALGEIA